MDKLEGKYLTLTLLEDKNLKLELTPEGRERIKLIESRTILPNDHQILRALLEDQIEADNVTWEYGNTVAMHGSFLIIGHGGILSAHTEADGDVADYWYDNYYAVRDIIADLIYNFDNKGRTMSMMLREPKPVILWLGPKDE